MKVWVNYDNKRWKSYKIDFEKIASMAVDATYSESEVSVVLTDDAEIHKLNKQYRNIDRPTNVLSFELGDDVLLGDIYISLDTVEREAQAANISVAEHTAHMVVHGMLHLQGYDHLTDAEAEVMEAKEIQILQKLGIKNPYSDDGGDENLKPVRVGKIIQFVKNIIVRPWLQCVVMGFMGLIAALGFAPFYLWPMTCIGIGGAYWIVVQQPRKQWWQVFLRVWAFAAMYAVAMFWWMLNSIYVVPELAAQFAIWTVPGLIGIAIAGGIIFSVPFMVVARVGNNAGQRPFVFAAVWCLVLWGREWLLTGFPWNPIANIALPNLLVANSMALCGALGLTFVIIGLISSVAELILNRRDKLVWITVAAFVVMGAIGIGYGVHNWKLSGIQNGNSPIIRLVQPAQSAVQKATHSRADAIKNAEINIRKLIELANAPGKPDLIVFPETSYPFVVADDDMPMATAVNADMIIGATSYNDDKLFNSMVLANKDGKINYIYSKSHLVPFGEYRPFGDIIPTPGQLTAGTGAEILSMDLAEQTFRFAPAICYEIVFSDSLVPRDAGQVDAIVNITNDTWFGKTPGTYQHLDMVRRYAIESGLPIVRANYSGISAFISADGNVVSQLPVGQVGYIDGTVWGAHKTLYRRIGREGAMIIILLIACIGAVSMSALYRRKK